MQIESAPHKNRMMLKACIQKLPVEIVSDVVFEDLASAFEPGGWGSINVSRNDVVFEVLASGFGVTVFAGGGGVDCGIKISVSIWQSGHLTVAVSPS